MTLKVPTSVPVVGCFDMKWIKRLVQLCSQWYNLKTWVPAPYIRVEGTFLVDLRKRIRNPRMVCTYCQLLLVSVAVCYVVNVCTKVGKTKTTHPWGKNGRRTDDDYVHAVSFRHFRTYTREGQQLVVQVLLPHSRVCLIFFSEALFDHRKTASFNIEPSLNTASSRRPPKTHHHTHHRSIAPTEVTADRPEPSRRRESKLFRSIYLVFIGAIDWCCADSEFPKEKSNRESQLQVDDK